MGRHLESRRGKKSARNATRREADHLRNWRSQKRGGHGDSRIREYFRSQESPREDCGGKTYRASSFTRGNQSQQAVRWFAPGPPRQTLGSSSNVRAISSAGEQLITLRQPVRRAQPADRSVHHSHAARSSRPTPQPKSRRKSCTTASPP